VDCFRNFVGLAGCGATTPDSGRYVNELPGISLESVDSLVNSEQISYAKLFTDLQTTSQSSFQNNIVARLTKRFRKKTLHESIDTGKVLDLATISAAANQYRGLSIELDCPSYSPFVNSTLFGLSWQSLSLYLSAVPASPIPVKIWDMDTKAELFTKTINNTANPVSVGWNEIKINQIFFKSLRQFAGYDATEIASPLLRFNPNYCCDGLVRGGQTVTKSDPSILGYGDNLFGLNAIFSVVCSYESLICNNKLLFVDAWLYHLGVNLIRERMFSDRWNWWTLDKDKLEDMLSYYTDQAEKYLNDAVDGIDLDLNDDCLECNAMQTIKSVHP